MLNQEARTLEHTPTTGMEVHEGDIFVSSWGYSMTLVDFYQVTKVSKTGKSVSVRRLASKVVSGNIDSPQGGYVIPDQGPFRGGGAEEQAPQGRLRREPPPHVQGERLRQRSSG